MERTLRAVRSMLESNSQNVWDAPLRTITVVEDNPVFLAAGGSSPETMGEIQRTTESFAKDLEEEALALGRETGVEVLPESVYGKEIDGIVDAASRHGIDTLILGIRSHGGLVDRLVSRTAHELAERSPCNILGVK